MIKKLNNIRRKLKNELRKIRFKIRLLTYRYRALPDFLIIGAQKAGTTSLYSYLKQHPKLHSSISYKELHFFDSHYQKGEAWYRANFPIKRANKLCYEGSTMYCFHPRAAERISQMLPNVKLIFLLREPVSRAYSSYQHQVRAGREKLSFSQAIRQEAERIQSDLERIQNDPSYGGKSYRYFSYVEQGKYSVEVKRLLDYFPKQQILFLDSHDLLSDPDRSLRRVFDFLKVPHVKIKTRKKFNTGNYNSHISEEDQAYLNDIFAPYNRELNTLLGIDFTSPSSN